MGYCPNCKTRLTCSCQNRVSKNGKAGCTNCITQLNVTPNTTKTQPSPGNAPTNVSATYTGPGKQT